MKKVLDVNDGVASVFHRQMGQNIIEHIQDVEPILEENKARAELHDKSQDWWFIGTIPNATCMQWAKESGQRLYSRGWHEYARKQLNLAENRKLNPNKIRLKISND